MTKGLAAALAARTAVAHLSEAGWTYHESVEHARAANFTGRLYNAMTGKLVEKSIVTFGCVC